MCLCLPSAGDDSNAHHCAKEKEEDGIDSCVDCWPHSVENPQCKSKKKKRKGKGLCNDQVREHTGEDTFCMLNIYRCELTQVCSFPQGQKGDGSLSEEITGHSQPTSHTCRTKEIFSSLCGGPFASLALQLPWAIHHNNLRHDARHPEANTSLVELLVSIFNFYLILK